MSIWDYALGGIVAITGWYIWYVGFHIPAMVAKMTPEAREKFIREWNAAGEGDLH